ncbi:MauE/DoxX family redox-associated membrane protein [Actinophytocola sp.]|uniref:MauE/DoxX family redox-associated membrane protein n=1 Tax=Actinophytocola sp. TaxID=1872138 RepID=UPI002ED0275C
MRYVVLGCDLLLIGVFAVSATGKLRSRAVFLDFCDSVRKVLGTRPDRARQLAAAVVAFEVVTVPTLVFLPAVGFLVAMLLCVTFAVALGRAVRHAVREPCRCFGSSSAPLGWRHAARAATLSLIALAGEVGVLTGAVLTGPIWLPGPWHPGGISVAVGAAAILVALTVFYDDIADLFAGVGAGLPREPTREGI